MPNRKQTMGQCLLEGVGGSGKLLLWAMRFDTHLYILIWGMSNPSNNSILIFFDRMD